MFLSEMVQMYNQKAEVVSLITSEEIEYLLSQKLGVKKTDFEDHVWVEIMSRSKKAIAGHLKDSLLISLIGNSLADYVQEGPIQLDTKNN